MKIAAVSDLHYSSETKAHVGQLAKKISHWNPDVLAVLGDIVDIQKTDDFERALALFRRIGSLRLFVPGNHDIFSLRDDPFQLYGDLDRRSHTAGFRFLPKAGVVKGGTGFVGTMGWYDYSLIPPESVSQDASFIVDGQAKSWKELAPADFARKTVWIKLASRTLKEIMEALPPEELMIFQIARRHGTVDLVEMMNRKFHFLSDLKFVKKTLPDEALCNRFTGELVRQLEQVSGFATRLVTMSHMVPFRQGVATPVGPERDFFSAYKGSLLLGKAVLTNPKVALHLHGHHHARGSPRQYRVGTLTVKNVSLPLVGDFTRIVLA